MKSLQKKYSSMSGWDAYIKNLLSASSSIRRAAIIGYPDGAVWARSEGSGEFKVNLFKPSFDLFILFYAFFKFLFL